MIIRRHDPVVAETTSATVDVCCPSLQLVSFVARNKHWRLHREPVSSTYSSKHGVLILVDVALIGWCSTFVDPRPRCAGVVPHLHHPDELLPHRFVAQGGRALARARATGGEPASGEILWSSGCEQLRRPGATQALSSSAGRGDDAALPTARPVSTEDPIRAIALTRLVTTPRHRRDAFRALRRPPRRTEQLEQASGAIRKTTVDLWRRALGDGAGS